MRTRARSTWILFTWEFRRRAKGRRRFYRRLEKLLGELERGNWIKIGGSVYLVDERCSVPVVELLKRFEGPDLRWFKFKVEDFTRVPCARRNSCATCSTAHRKGVCHTCDTRQKHRGWFVHVALSSHVCTRIGIPAQNWGVI
jgi:hypothetical protein